MSVRLRYRHNQYIQTCFKFYNPVTLSNLVGTFNQHHVVELTRLSVGYEAFFMSLGNCYQHFRRSWFPLPECDPDKNQLIPQL